MRKISIAFTLVALLALPTLAQAKPPHHNPGNSAGDEYSENVPGPNGDNGGNQNQGSGGSGGGGSLPPGTTQALEEQGSAGTGAANFANSTGPKAAKQAAHHNEGGNSSAENPTSSGGGGLGDVLKQVAGGDGNGSSDSDGMGLLLPIILGASVLGALAFLLARRRGGGTPGTA